MPLSAALETKFAEVVIAGLKADLPM